MAIHIGWDDDSKRIVRATVEGRYAWEDLERALGEAIELMDSVAHKVHFVIDIRRGHLDVGSAIGQAQKAATPETHHNEGMKVVVGANFMVKTVYQAYRKVTQAMGKDQEFHFANSLEDARAMIKSKTKD
jgi:hypothetical protein